MTVARLEREMDSREYSYWMAHYRLEPFGAMRDDLRALYCGGMAVAPYTKQGKAPEFKVYFSHLAKTPHRMTDEEMMMNAMGWTTASGGEIN
jgi:hypothetical protein